MEVIVGNRTLETEKLTQVAWSASHSTYDPRRPEPTGLTCSYEIRDAGDLYLLVYSVVNQRSEDEDDVITSRDAVPLTGPLGELITSHFRSHSRPAADRRQDLTFVVHDFDAVLRSIRERQQPDDGLNDLVHDLEEMKLCLSAGAFRGSLALAGRALESSLKAILHRAGRKCDSNWMVGKLLSEMEEAGIYVDPGMKNVWNLINQQRIVGVHAKEAAPIPSREQAIMVAYAVVDTLKRRLAETA